MGVCPGVQNSDSCTPAVRNENNTNMLAFTAPSDGTYAIVVWSLQGMDGEYDIQI
jgi:hypothetical protein